MIEFQMEALFRVLILHIIFEQLYPRVVLCTYNSFRLCYFVLFQSYFLHILREIAVCCVVILVEKDVPIVKKKKNFV